MALVGAACTSVIVGLALFNKVLTGPILLHFMYIASMLHINIDLEWCYKN